MTRQPAKLHEITELLGEIEAVKAEAILATGETAAQIEVETAPDAVVVVDFEGKIVAWNPGARDIFGYEEHEVIGANVTTLMPERYRKKHEAGMKRLRNLGEARLIFHLMVANLRLPDEPLERESEEVHRIAPENMDRRSRESMCVPGMGV